MAEPFVGEIRQYPYTFAPAGFWYCAGQVVPIAENQLLYAVISNFFGGNGSSTMGIPDLRGRSVMQYSKGPGLTNWAFAQREGLAAVPLISEQIPTHNHGMLAKRASLNDVVDSGSGNYLSTAAIVDVASGNRNGQLAYSNDASNPIGLANETIGLTGTSEVHENRQPFIAIPFCIAIEGIFPSRN